jgi:uncharacterized RDD family membrane protein YckC
MKCPNCDYVSYQNTEECIKCGAPVPPADEQTANDADFRRGVRRKERPQLGFGFPVEEEPETAVETQATLSAPIPKRVVEETSPSESTEAWNVGEPDTDDSSYGSGTHWAEEPSASTGTWVEVYRLASGFGRRAGAMAIDSAVFLGFFGILVFVLQTGGQDFSLLSATFVPAYVFVLVLHAFYFTFFHAVLGQTPGKMVTRIRVVSAFDGALLSPWDSFMRWIGYFMSGLPVGLGFLWSIIDNDDRAWHDRWAKSVVVLVDSQVGNTTEASQSAPVLE